MKETVVSCRKFKITPKRQANLGISCLKSKLF